MNRFSLLALCLWSLLGSPAALADVLDPQSRFSLGGFGTVGLAHNSTDGAEYIRDILQPHGVSHGWSGNVDSRLGLQAGFRANAQIDGAVQAVSLYDHAGSYRPEVVWAFVGYSPDPGLKARAGRLGFDAYMLADTRNVGYSYLWVRPPVEYFGPLQITHIDGADATFKRDLGGWLASAKLYAGRAQQEIPGANGAEFDVSGSSVAGANIDFRRGDWYLRMGYTQIHLAREYAALTPLLAALRGIGSPQAAALAGDLAFDGKIVRSASAGGAWEHGPWQAQLVYNRTTSDALPVSPTDSAYFLLGRRIGSWTAFATLAANRGPLSDRSSGLPTPNPLDDAVKAVLVGGRTDQRSLSIGARYDFAPNFDLKMQLDQVRASDNARLTWRNPRADWNGRATVLSITLDFVF